MEPESWMYLMPSHLLRKDTDEYRRTDVATQIRWVKKIEMPSIIECLLNGRQPKSEGVSDSRQVIIERGMSQKERANRMVLMQYQHRMHPDISKFSRTYVYRDAALKDDPTLNREWAYPRYPRRFEFFNVRSRE